MSLAESALATAPLASASQLAAGSGSAFVGNVAFSLTFEVVAEGIYAEPITGAVGLPLSIGLQVAAVHGVVVESVAFSPIIRTVAYGSHTQIAYSYAEFAIPFDFQALGNITVSAVGSFKLPLAISATGYVEPTGPVEIVIRPVANAIGSVGTAGGIGFAVPIKLDASGQVSSSHVPGIYGNAALPIRFNLSALGNFKPDNPGDVFFTLRPVVEASGAHYPATTGVVDLRATLKFLAEGYSPTIQAVNVCVFDRVDHLFVITKTHREYVRHVA